MLLWKHSLSEPKFSEFTALIGDVFEQELGGALNNSQCFSILVDGLTDVTATE